MADSVVLLGLMEDAPLTSSVLLLGLGREGRFGGWSEGNGGRLGLGFDLLGGGGLSGLEGRGGRVGLGRG